MPLPTDPSPTLSAYAHPERLVTADWLSAHLGAPGLAIVESDEDVLLYDVGHIPGAVKVDWHTDLNDPTVRDYIDGQQFAALMDRKGIARDDTVVIYGDKSNWWAAYALWVFTLFGHPDVRLLNGGRDLWLAERRDTTLEVPDKTSTGYPVVQRNDGPIRAYKDDVLDILGNQPLIDVRSPDEYTGKRTHMPEYPEEGVLRGGHIPTARSIPWSKAVDERAVPQPRGTGRALRLLEPRRQDRRLLPHRRAVQSYLVRAHAFARQARRPQLRRVVDRVGQHRARADRRGRRSGSRARAMSLPAPLAEVVSDFAEVQGQDKLKLLLEFADELPALPAELEEQAMEPVPECQSPLFLHVDASNPQRVRLHFSAPAEAPTTRGFASILAAGLDGQPAADILAVPEDFYAELGLAALISPLRLRGMSAMLARIKRRLRETA